jgi:hypothetical protein
MSETEPGTTLFACGVIESGGAQGAWLILILKERHISISAGG